MKAEGKIPCFFRDLTATSEFFASRRPDNPARRFAHYFATKLAAFCPGLGMTEQKERWRTEQAEGKESEGKNKRKKDREDEGPEERRYPPG